MVFQLLGAGLGPMFSIVWLGAWGHEGWDEDPRRSSADDQVFFLIRMMHVMLQMLSKVFPKSGHSLPQTFAQPVARSVPTVCPKVGPKVGPKVWANFGNGFGCFRRYK